MLTADGYGSSVELDNGTLRVVAKGRMGRGALGTDERLISLEEVTAIDFEPAGRMRNGRLEIVDSRGRTTVHFRHKQNADMLALYQALPSIEGSTDVTRISEDRDHMIQRIEEHYAKR